MVCESAEHRDSENGRRQRQQEIQSAERPDVDINGVETDVFHLKKGMDVTATVIKEVPETVVAQQAKVTGQAPPPPPPPPPAAQPMIVEVEEVAVVEEAAAPAPAALPKTGSLFPLIGLIGGLMMAGSAGMRLVRK